MGFGFRGFRVYKVRFGVEGFRVWGLKGLVGWVSDSGFQGAGISRSDFCVLEGVHPLCVLWGSGLEMLSRITHTSDQIHTYEFNISLSPSYGTARA